MRAWFRLLKLKRQLRNAEIAHRKFQQSEEYIKLSWQEKEREDCVFHDVDYLPIFEEIEEIKTNKFLAKVRRYGIPYISWWNDEKQEFWVHGRCLDTHYLNVHGYHKLRAEIREEQKARREMVLGWIPLITAIAGLLGIITGLVSIIKYWRK